MKLSAVITFIVSAMSISASPILKKREIGGVLMCTGANSTGFCDYQVFKLKKCHQLPKPLYHNITTFAPDGEDFECFPRTTNCKDICKSPTGCTFGAVDHNYPHKENLTAIEWNTLFSSFDCSLKKKKGEKLNFRDVKPLPLP
ncbi:SSCRP protein [Fusarium austroafricanum]|uniref:SSCRP protein n=1 Tax=Fusarium austroafricanum TaxID=2364996 RepID=A0A8H4P374_9HYPO|nr:SSCRP protein [Fusarium austroafricanum]